VVTLFAQGTGGLNAGRREPQAFFPLLEKKIDDIVGANNVPEKRGLFFLDVWGLSGKKIRVRFFGFFSICGPCAFGLQVKEETSADADVLTEECLAGLQDLGFGD
jgi:hypothetical protein